MRSRRCSKTILDEVTCWGIVKLVTTGVFVKLVLVKNVFKNHPEIKPSNLSPSQFSAGVKSYCNQKYYVKIPHNISYHRLNIESMYICRYVRTYTAVVENLILHIDLIVFPWKSCRYTVFKACTGLKWKMWIICISYFLKWMFYSNSL